MDTQWPRFEVFEQERPGQPHRNAGSVHAPDAELALQNARDVFVRRPDCSSLWVAPAGLIFSRTAEELAKDSQPDTQQATVPEQPEPYEVFHKHSQRQSETYVTHLGQVEARSPDEALRQAQAKFSGEPAFVWWVVPALAILRSEPADAESWFDPARHKPYRQASFYQVLTQMRAIKAGGAPDEPEAA